MLIFVQFLLAVGAIHVKNRMHLAYNFLSKVITGFARPNRKPNIFAATRNTIPSYVVFYKDFYFLHIYIPSKDKSKKYMMRKK